MSLETVHIYKPASHGQSHTSVEIQEPKQVDKADIPAVAVVDFMNHLKDLFRNPLGGGSLLEKKDAPGDVSTPYLLEHGEVFRGHLERRGADWIAVNLEAGRNYEFYAELEGMSAYFNLPVVLRDSSGQALTPEVSSYSMPSNAPRRVVFTAEATGVYFLEPQLDPNYAFPKEYRNYTLKSEDYGTVGLSETIDAPYFHKIHLYELSEGETFAGSTVLADADTNTGDAGDGIWLNFERSGQYKVILTQTGANNGASLVLNVGDVQVIAPVAVKNNRAELVLEIAGPTQRHAVITNSQNSKGGEYELSLEYIGPIDRDKPLDWPYDETRPVDSSPYIETDDLPENTSSVVLKPGDTLIGSLHEEDRDTVGFKVEAGTAYTIWYTGSGVNPLESGGFSPHEAKGVYNSSLGTTHFVATKGGKIFFTLDGSSYNSSQPGDYSFTLAETTRLDEVHDAPGDTSTPYRLGKDGRFSGTLTDGDADWIAVRLTKGETYELYVNPDSPGQSYSPLFRNKSGKALTYQLDDSSYPPWGPTLHTAKYSGVHFVQPQGEFIRNEYELMLKKYGVVGLEEIVDARGGLSSPYVVSDGETFSGAVTFTGNSNDDYIDSVRLDLSPGGIYRVTLELSDGESGSELDIEIYDTNHDWPVETASVKNDNAQTLFYAHPGSEYVASVSIFGNGSEDYEVSVELVTSPEIDEISDLPDRPHRKTDPLTAGSTFRGYSEASGDDFIPIQTEAGSIYRLKSSGFGSILPYDPNHLQVVDANGNTLSTQQLYAEYLLIDAPEAGTYFVRLHANNRDISSHGLYEISFEEYDGHVTGTRKADWLPGSRLDEIVFARGDNDTVYGESGNDSLYGEKGHDNLSGGDGEDSLLGGAGSDTLHGGADGDRLDGGAGQDRLDGSNGDDVLRGGAQSDFLLGGDGNDRLLGEQGNDRLAGGSGDDLLHGGNGHDLLNGLEGSDYIKGGNGNDTLNGNDGWDLLNGGEGSDVFVFDKPVSFEIDAIEKFSFSDDTILISSKGLRGRTAEDIASSARLVQGGEIIDFGPVGSAFLVEFDTSGLLINIKSDRYVFLIGETHTDQLSDVFDFF